MGGNKQSNKKKQEQHKKAPENEINSQKVKLSSKQKNKQASKPQPACGRSCLGKLNILLVLTAVVLAVRVLYLHTNGDLSGPGLERARGRLAASWAVLSAHSADRVNGALQWVAERAGQVDRYLTETQRPYWLPVKRDVGRAWNVTRHYGAIAGERVLAVSAVVVRKTWEAAKPHCDTARAAVKPYWDSAMAAAKPHWDMAVQAAKPQWDTALTAAAKTWNATATATGPLIEVVVAQATAVKAGVLGAAARLRQDGGPVLAEWAAALQRVVGDSWEVVQREAPKYAATAGLWLARSWDYVRTEGGLYASAVAEKVRQAMVGLAGGA